jgi:hypothetical protein
MSFNDFEEADIDQTGRFKYILIKLVEKSTKEELLIVRGYEWAGFHGITKINHKKVFNNITK